MRSAYRATPNKTELERLREENAALVHDIGRYVEISAELATENARLRQALQRIASFNDVSAEYHLKTTGSYSYFDEPASVEIARDALTASAQSGSQAT